MREYEWILEIRARPGTEVYKMFEQRLAKMPITNSEDEYYLRFLDWSPASTKDFVRPESPKDMKIELMAALPLEDVIARYTEKNWNKYYDYRFRNIKTGETIPAELLCQ